MKLKVYFDRSLFWSLFFGGPLIFLIIWNRFIRLRLPIDIIPTPSFTLLDFIIVCLFIFYFCLFIYHLFKIFESKNNENSIFDKLIAHINKLIKRKYCLNNIFSTINYATKEYILKGPHRIYDRAYKYSSQISKFVSKFVNFFANFLNFILWINPGEKYSFLYLKLFCIFFLILPRLFPCVIFLGEILLYQKFDLFYKSLILLVVPLITNLILFIIKHDIEIRLDYISEFYFVEFDIYSRKKNDFIIDLKKKKNKNLQEFKESYIREEDVKTIWINLQNYYNIINQIEICYERMKNLFQIILFGIYTLGFLLYFLILQGIFPFIFVNNINLFFYKILDETKKHFFIWICMSLVLFLNIFKKYLVKLFYDFVKIKPLTDYINKNLTFVLEKYKFSAYMICLFLYVIPISIVLFNFAFDLIFNKCFLSLNKVFFLIFITNFFDLILFICIYHLKKSLTFYARFYDIKFNKEENKISVFYKKLENPEDIEDFKAYSDVENILNDWELFNDSLDILLKLQKIIKYSVLSLIILFTLLISYFNGWIYI